MYGRLGVEGVAISKGKEDKDGAFRVPFPAPLLPSLILRLRASLYLRSSRLKTDTPSGQAAGWISFRPILYIVRMPIYLTEGKGQ